MARRFSDAWIERTRARLEPLLSRPHASAKLPVADLYGLLIALEDARSALLRRTLEESVNRVLGAEKRARAPTPVRPLRRDRGCDLRRLRSEPPENLVSEWSPDD
jgi:hypothetical protein